MGVMAGGMLRQGGVRGLGRCLGHAGGSRVVVQMVGLVQGGAIGLVRGGARVVRVAQAAQQEVVQLCGCWGQVGVVMAMSLTCRTLPWRTSCCCSCCGRRALQGCSWRCSHLTTCLLGWALGTMMGRGLRARK